MPIKKLKNFLDRNRVKYVTISHSPAYTAQEIAACAGVSGRELAKTVMVKLDGAMAMAVLPASWQVDLNLLAQAAGAKKAELATEAEFQGLFPACEVGAMPPFGNLYSMKVFVSPHLAEDEEIAFNAGKCTELIRLKYKAYSRHVKPVLAAFDRRP